MYYCVRPSPKDPKRWYVLTAHRDKKHAFKMKGKLNSEVVVGYSYYGYKQGDEPLRGMIEEIKEQS